MKQILFITLICLAFSYDNWGAVNYARTYCANYNGWYNNYRPPNGGGDCANFVSQCLLRGGADLSQCYGTDSKGAIPYVPNLKSCLTQLGWKSSRSRPAEFYAGYPMFLEDYHAMICTEISGDTVYYCAHTEDVCNRQLYGSPIYYYL